MKISQSNTFIKYDESKLLTPQNQHQNNVLQQNFFLQQQSNQQSNQIDQVDAENQLQNLHQNYKQHLSIEDKNQLKKRLEVLICQKQKKFQEIYGDIDLLGFPSATRNSIRKSLAQGKIKRNSAAQSQPLSPSQLKQNQVRVTRIAKLFEATGKLQNFDGKKDETMEDQSNSQSQFNRINFTSTHKQNVRNIKSAVHRSTRQSMDQRETKWQQKHQELVDGVIFESFFNDITKVYDEEKGGYKSLLYTAKCLMDNPISPLAHKRQIMSRKQSQDNTAKSTKNFNKSNPLINIIMNDDINPTPQYLKHDFSDLQIASTQIASTPMSNSKVLFSPLASTFNKSSQNNQSMIFQGQQSQQQLIKPNTSFNNQCINQTQDLMQNQNLANLQKFNNRSRPMTAIYNKPNFLRHKRFSALPQNESYSKNPQKYVTSLDSTNNIIDTESLSQAFTINNEGAGIFQEEIKLEIRNESIRVIRLAPVSLTCQRNNRVLFGLGVSSAKIISSILIQRVEYKQENISQIILSNNQLRDDGIAILATAIKQLRCLVHLDVASNEITAKGAKDLCERGLCENENIVSLNIGSVEGLCRNRITWQGGQYLAKLLSQECNMIQILKVGGTNLGNKGFIYLVNCFKHKTNIRIIDLDISQNEIEFDREITQKFQDVLDNMNCLINLNLSKNTIADDNMILLSPVFSNMRHLKKLQLSSCKLTIKGISQFFYNIQASLGLQKINLNHNDFKAEFSLKDETQKSQLQLIQEFFNRNTRLKSINFKSCKMNDLLLRFICQGLMKNKSINSLNLSQNFLTDQSAKELQKVLMCGKSGIQNLKLSCNKLYDKAAFELALVIRNSKHFQICLKKLDISNNMIQKDGAYALKHAIDMNTRFLSLNLEMNVSIPYLCIIQIQKTLEFNRSLIDKQYVPNLKTEKHFLQTRTKNQNINALKDEIKQTGGVKLSEFNTLKILERTCEVALSSQGLISQQYQIIKDESNEVQDFLNQMDWQIRDVEHKQTKVYEKNELALKKTEKDIKDTKTQQKEISKEIKQAKLELKRRKEQVSDEMQEYKNHLRMLLKKIEVQEYMIKGKETEVKELQFEIEQQRILKEFREQQKQEGLKSKQTFKRRQTINKSINGDLTNLTSNNQSSKNLQDFNDFVVASQQNIHAQNEKVVEKDNNQQESMIQGQNKCSKIAQNQTENQGDKKIAKNKKKIRSKSNKVISK
eukprot:403351983